MIDILNQINQINTRLFFHSVIDFVLSRYTCIFFAKIYLFTIFDELTI